MKKWLLRIGFCIMLAGGLWFLSTFDYSFDYSGVENLASERKIAEPKGKIRNNDGWHMPITMR